MNLIAKHLDESYQPLFGCSDHQLHLEMDVKMGVKRWILIKWLQKWPKIAVFSHEKTKNAVDFAFKMADCFAGKYEGGR